MRWSRNSLPALTLAASVLVGACTDESTTAPVVGPQFNTVGEPALILLKKIGPNPPYTFQLSATTGSLEAGSTVTFTNTEWLKVWVATNTTPGTFTATEVLAPGVTADSVSIVQLVRGADGNLTEGAQTIVRGPASASTTVNVNYDLGAYIIVWNSGSHTPPPPPPPPPGGAQGCTPGYWKQSHHFDSWRAPYTPTMQFSAVFANAFPGKTLVQILGNGGGGLNALGRHTVAALLNTASAGVNYGLTPADVINAFNAAYATGNYEALKNHFEGLNERGCPLN